MFDNDTSTYQSATHYSYDIHGNVDHMAQEINETNLLATGLNIKYIDYDYDLVSGKVNRVAYNTGRKDQYFHKYEYDGDNRITHVYTSKDNIWWDNDAQYGYYNHGPLARTLIGDLQVQGVDYAYTLHGWLKGVNSNTLQTNRDIGKDGEISTPRQFVGRDAMGYTLGYYNSDYQGIKAYATTDQFEAYTAGSDLMAARENLYNGNISHMVTATPFISDYNINRVITPSVRGGAYQYDQLNRLKEARSFFNIDVVNNEWENGGGSPVDYLENFTYDAMGNIKHVNRWGNGGLQMDNMDYRYNTKVTGELISNKLYHVNDAINSANYSDDIDDQGTFTNIQDATINTLNNYGYDEQGNLVRDDAEQIATIEWTVYGKIKKVIRTTASTKPDLEYIYDAGGNRICKIVKPKPLNCNTYNYYYYLRDAQGNEMANYKLQTNTSCVVDTLLLTSHPIYGSSRLGLDDREVLLYNGTDLSLDTATNIKDRILTHKQYELSNHLGNVLVTVSDKKIAKSYGTSGVDYFDPDIVTITDYYAFGAPMPGRHGVEICYTDTTITIDSMYVDMIDENFSSGVGSFAGIAINDNSAIANIIGDELHVQAVWPDNATAYRQVTLVSGMSYTLIFDLVSSASIGSSTMECAILMPGDIQTHVISSGPNVFTFTSSYTGTVDIEFSYITDQDDAYSAFTPSFDIDNVVLREYPLREHFESYSVGSFVPNTAVSPSSTVANITGNVLNIGATWPNRPTAFKSIYLENGITYTVNFDLNSLFIMGVVNTMECRVHLPGGSVVNQYTSTGNKVFTFVSNTTGWVDFEFAYLTNPNPMYAGWTPSIDIDNALVYRTIVNENFSSSSVGSFTNTITGGSLTTSVSAPSGTLRLDASEPYRASAERLIPVTAGDKYSIDFDVAAIYNLGVVPHDIRLRVEMAGYPTQHFIYNTIASIPTVYVNVPTGFAGTDIRVEISSIMSSSAHTPGSFIEIDNFKVKHWEGVTSYTFDTICSVNGKKYRYGFNGKEKDDETYGEGNAYDFGARIYDSRLGRWLSMDPMSDDFVDESPYIFCYDNPIYFVDEGGEFGIPGMIKAGLFEYAGQVASNIITSGGKKSFKQMLFDDIDFNDVGASAIQGIFDPRAGSKRWVKIGAKIINLGLEYYKASTDAMGSGENKNAFNGTKSWSETNTTFGIAIGANYAGSKITNKVSSSKISKSAEVYKYSSLAKSYAKKANTALVLKRPKSNIETKVVFAAVNQAQAVKATDKIVNSVKAVANPINNTVQNTTTKLIYPSNTSSPSAPSSPVSSVIQFKPIPAGDGYYYLNPSRTEIYNSADRTISTKVDNKWKVTKTHANIDVNKSQVIKR